MFHVLAVYNEAGDADVRELEGKRKDEALGQLDPQHPLCQPPKTNPDGLKAGPHRPSKEAEQKEN